MLGSLDEGGTWEEANAVLAAIEAEGYQLTRNQLRRWHRFGVVGRPIQIHQGARGSIVFYPPGTTALLLVACEIAKSERRLDRIIWILWWRGQTSPDMGARRLMRNVADTQSRTLKQLISDEGVLSEGAQCSLDEADRARVRPSLAMIRRRSGTQSFGEVLQSLLLVGAGRSNELTDDAVDQLEHALGMDRARSDVLGSTGKPWLEGDPRSDLENISKLSDPSKIVANIDNASDDELNLARNEVKHFCTGISDLAYVMRESGDNWSYGIAAWGRSFDDLREDATGQAYLVGIWLTCKEEGSESGMQSVLDSIAVSPDLRAEFDTLVSLRNAVPEVAAAIPLNWFSRSMRDPDYYRKLQDAIAALRLEHGEKIDAFFESRNTAPDA